MFKKENWHRSNVNWIGMVLVVLLFGIVATIFVSWTFAYFRSPPDYPRDPSMYFVKWRLPWMVTPARRVGLESLWWLDLRGSYPSHVGVSPEVFVQGIHAREVQKKSRSRLDQIPSWGTFQSEQLMNTNENTVGLDLGFGFPYPCFWYRIIGESYETVGSNPVVTIRNEVLTGGLLVSGKISVRSGNFCVLPLRPVWFGIVVNILFYATLCFSLVFLPRIIRAYRRQKVGMCVVCGYDLVGISGKVCSECGSTIAR